MVFLIDRKDLDDQTVDEYNSFEKDCVDNSDSTHVLVKQLQDSDRKMIVTTIQKMANAVKSKRYSIDNFDAYRKDITKRMKQKDLPQVDILLVVNMMLTGFAWYLYYKDQTSNPNPKVPVDIDFDVELVRTDRINVVYILNLLKSVNKAGKTPEGDIQKCMRWF